MTMRISPAAAISTLFACAASAPAAPTPIAAVVPPGKTVASYTRDVADVLAAKCVGCHSDALAENRLNLEDVAGMLKGGKRGPAVVPGKADESLLFRMAAHRVEPVMPPAGKKDTKPLTPEELGLLKRWIDAGAKDDSDENAEAPAPVQLGELPPGVQPVNAVDLTADGARVACGRANVVQVYDVDSGLEVISLGGHKDLIQSVRFSPDGRRLAAGSYQIVTLWDVPTGGHRRTFAGHTNGVRGLALAPGTAGVYYSGGLDRTVRVWNETGKAVASFAMPSAVASLTASRDGRTLAVGGSDGVIRVLHANDGKQIRALSGHTGPVNDLAFLPDGRLASASADGTARLWSVPADHAAKAPAPAVLRGHKGPVHAVSVLPGGRAVVTGGEDGTVRLWGTADGAAGWVLTAHDAPVLALAVSPGGDRILTGSADRTARLFDAATGVRRAVLSGHPGAVNSVAFSPAGDRVATAGAGGGIKVWEADTGQAVIAFGHTPAAKDKGTAAAAVRRLAFTADGALVSASDDRTVKTWAFEGSWRERRPLGPHAFRVLALDFNPDGTLLAAGAGEPSRSGEIRLWEVGKGLPVRTLDGVHSDTVFGLRFSPDGTRLASAGADKFLKVTRVADGKELRSFEGHSHHVLAVDWRPDGKQLATGGGDNVLKLWDFETGEGLKTFQGAGKQVTSVRWVAGSKPVIAGASGDASVRTWDAANGSVRRTFQGPGDYVFAVAATADGARLAAGTADGALFLWDGRNGDLLRKIGPGER
jgi:WD40 repeat protein